MKDYFFKTGILFVLLTFTVSCNEDTETSKNTNNGYLSKYNKGELEIAKDLFINMIKTSEYLDYKNSIDIFAEKMNGNAILFPEKEGYMSWIAINLSKTKFSSSDEFSNMIDDMIAKNTILESKNAILFSYLDNADQDQFLEIVQPSLAIMPTVTTFSSCTNQCISDYNDAENGNEWAYANNYGIGHTNFAHNMATSIYWIRVKSIIDSFSACVGSC